MLTRLASMSVALLALLPAAALPAPAGTMAIGWNDLRPAETVSAATGETLSWSLQGKTVELAGYVLPSDREGDMVYQFLLLPWGGLCSHVAPPPANQAVLITLKKPFKLRETYQTVSVTGVIEPELEKTQLFILDGVAVIESGYSISGAQIAPADKVTGAAAQPKSNPWSFLRK